MSPPSSQTRRRRRRRTSASPGGRCCPGCSTAPRSARWSARSSSTSSSSRSRRRSATLESLSSVLYVSSTFGIPAVGRGAADDRRRVRPVRRCRGDHVGAGRLDVQLPVHHQHVGRRARLAGGGAGDRLHQRLPGGEDRDSRASWSRSARSSCCAASTWPSPRSITGNVATNDVSNIDGFDSAQKVFASTFSIGGVSIRITLLWWILFVVVGHLGAAAHARSATGSSRSAASAPSARAVGVPVNRVKIGLFMAVGVHGLVHRHAHPVRVQHRAVRRGRRQRVHLHHRRGGRRLPADRRVRLGDRRGHRRASSSA